jgi:hypothetical protein
VHAISATAREKIEAAGGSVELLREPKQPKKRHHKTTPAATAESESSDEARSEAPEPEADATPEAEPAEE